jgi:hypothetical protein
MKYFIRTNCIFCNSKLNDEYFVENYAIPIASYSKYECSTNDIIIPYNIYICKECKTSQIKYLGNLDEIYKINHADSTGIIMMNMHKKVLYFIKKYKQIINNIVEVGCSKGVLSDFVLNDSLVDKYFIIEPSYFGSYREHKYIINDYFENVDFSVYKDCNTILISHVFEHFYNPLEILEKIQSNKNILNFLLVWPDLEYYKDNNVYHLLNTEHTYYVDNSFIIKLLNNYFFELIEKYDYEGHSVIFIFKRNELLAKTKLINSNYNIDNFYNNLLDNKKIIDEFIETNKSQKICIWPCSVHTQFLLMMIKDTRPHYVLDNSPNKIGKYLYGYNIQCLDFQQCINNDYYAIILNGGVYNNEIKNLIKNSNVLFIN